MPQHETPVAVAGPHVEDVAAGGDLLEDGQGLMRGAHAPEMMHEHGEHMVGAADGLGLRAGPGPLEIPARPLQERQVRVRRGQAGDILEARDLEVRQRRVQVTLLQQVGRDRDAQGVLLGVQGERLEDVGRHRRRAEDGEVGVYVRSRGRRGGLPQRLCPRRLLLLCFRFRRRRIIVLFVVVVRGRSGGGR